MTDQNMCKTLPDHLVERIISTMPFPAIFQARCLSTSWNARFESVDLQSGEEKKRAMSFQSLVIENCGKWKTFCPVRISWRGDLVAYDKESNKWAKLPSVSFLPQYVMQRCSVQIEGALLYAYDTPESAHDGFFFVANILTRTWRRLPGPPVTYSVINSSKLVISDGTPQSYKLILFSQRTLSYDDIHFVVFYDSVSREWRQETIFDGEPNPLCHFRRNSVELKGVLYTGSIYSPPHVCAFNLDGGSFERLNLTLCDRLGQAAMPGGPRWGAYKNCFNYFHLVVCKNELFMLAGTPRNYEKLLKVEVGVLKLLELGNVYSHSPFVHRSTTMGPMAPVGDERHIWFGYKNCVSDCQYIRAYNVQERNWSNLFAVPTLHNSWIASMKPSLSPFLCP